MIDSLPLADLVWSAAFHQFGTWAFVVVAGVLLLEAPLLKWRLRTPWDDTVGAVFLGHLTALVAALVVGIGFTNAVQGFDSGALRSWGDVAALLGRIFATIWAASLEVLSWPSTGKLALFSALGFSSLVFLASARAILHVPWTTRNVVSILGVSLLTALGIGVGIVAMTRSEVPVETL